MSDLRSARIRAIREYYYQQARSRDFFIDQMLSVFGRHTADDVATWLGELRTEARYRIIDIMIDECEHHISDEYDRHNNPEGRFVVCYDKDSVRNGFCGKVLGAQRRVDGFVTHLAVRDERSGKEIQLLRTDAEVELGGIHFGGTDCLYVDEDRTVVTHCWRSGR